jgi:hypothetical protein
VPYLRRLVISLTGVTLGELVGVFIAGPRLGELHPLWDALLTAAMQLTANRFVAGPPPGSANT